MPDLKYSRYRSDMECKAAKERLKEFYRFKYGYVPPQGWEVDHQVEQHVLYYQRFGSKRIHHIANMLMVPKEVNYGKNILYNKSWDHMPPKYHQRIPRAVDRAAVNPRTLNIRDHLYLVSEMMEDDEAWSLLTEFSKDTLLIVVEEMKRTRWATEPPEWFKKYPHWLGRMLEDLDNHSRFIAEFGNYTRKLWDK